MKLPLKELVWDTKIYPRPNKSIKTIEAYTEALQVGAKFPPLEVQRVSNYRNGTDEAQEAYLITDGVHRKLAYEALGDIAEIEVDEWQPGVTLDYEASWLDLKLRGAELNIRHGDRLSESNKESLAKEVAENDPEETYTLDALASTFVVNPSTISRWISPIRTRQKAKRDSVILRLSRLGWTQEEIANTINLTQQRVQQKITNFLHVQEICNFLQRGETMEWICDHLGIDLALAWSLRLDGKTDQERFGGASKAGQPPAELGWGLRTWDNWAFNKCDDRFGDNWPGQIPAQLVAHALFYFTNQGDLVFDPMAGGGVVPDTCLAFNRKCRAYDIATRRNRPEIEAHYWELDNMVWPDLKKKPDLIFFDPPYYDKKQKEYEGKAAESNNCSAFVPLSSLPRGDYLRFFEQFFALANENTKENARLAFLNADWRDFQSKSAIEEDPTQAITMLNYATLMQKAGWIITHIIDCPMSSQRFGGGIVESMQANRTLGVIRRTLLIAKKG